MKHLQFRIFAVQIPFFLFVFSGRGASLSISRLDPSRRHASTVSTSRLEADKVRPGSMDEATMNLGRVPYGEASRKYRRTVFTHKDWLDHRSNDRLVSNLVSMFFSGVIRQVKNKILLVSFVALFVTLWDDFLVKNYFENLPHLCLPTIPFLLSSPALGLLLVFRTNASYQRWLEGSRLWGTVKSHSRNIVRMASTFTDLSPSSDPKNRQAIDDLANSIWVLSRSIMNRLMGEDDEYEYRQQLKEECIRDGYFVDRLIREEDRASAALMEVSLALDHIPVDEKRRCEIDKSIILLGDAIYNYVDSISKIQHVSIVRPLADNQKKCDVIDPLIHPSDIYPLVSIPYRTVWYRY